MTKLQNCKIAKVNVFAEVSKVKPMVASSVTAAIDEIFSGPYIFKEITIPNTSSSSFGSGCGLKMQNI